MPKGKTTSKTFVTAMIKIIKDSELDKNSIKWHDFKTQTLINIEKIIKNQMILNGIIIKSFTI